MFPFRGSASMVLHGCAYPRTEGLSVAALIIYRIAKVFARQSPGLTARNLMVFSAVAADPHQTQSHYAAELGMKPSTVSAICQRLGDGRPPKKIGGKRGPGLGLIETRSNVLDGREVLHSITPKGQGIIRDVQTALDAAMLLPASRNSPAR